MALIGEKKSTAKHINMVKLTAMRPFTQKSNNLQAYQVNNTETKATDVPWMARNINAPSTQDIVTVYRNKGQAMLRVMRRI